MKHALRIIGTTLACGFLVWVLFRGLDAMPRVDFTSVAVVSALASATGLYVLSQCGAALAWSKVLGAWNISLPTGYAESQVLLSLIGKYIPGNVGQFVGRFALARRDGVPGAVIGIAVLVDTALLIGAGCVIVLGFALLDPTLLTLLLEPVNAAPTDDAIWIVPAFFGFAAALGGALLQRAIRKRGAPPAQPLRLALPFLVHLANFAVLGLSVIAVAHAIVPGAEINLALSCMIFVVAWIAGFVVPGAPGGVGIRDGILAVGLGLFIGQGAGLTVALLHRGVSVAGDVIVFLTAVALRRMLVRDIVGN